MGNQLVGLSVYVFLTRVMKVELLQDVSFAACGKSAPRSVVHLDGVAVVDNAQWNRVVIKFESSETRSGCTFYVDGRLPFANCARGIGRGPTCSSFPGPRDLYNPSAVTAARTVRSARAPSTKE